VLVDAERSREAVLAEDGLRGFLYRSQALGLLRLENPSWRVCEENDVAVLDALGRRRDEASGVGSGGRTKQSDKSQANSNFLGMGDLLGADALVG
jgi:hypothetical protein